MTMIMATPMYVVSGNSSPIQDVYNGNGVCDEAQAEYVRY
jgi:hypothetical protein